jgi:hypothetical protein
VDPTDPPVVRVIAMARAWRRVAIDEPNRYAVLSMLLAEPRVFVPDPVDGSEALDAASAALAPLVLSLTEAAASGALAPGDALRRAALTFSLVHGVLQLRKQVPRLPALLQLVGLVDDGLRALLLGWGASPAELDDAFAPRGAA